jgi:hypothetical protein
MSWLNLQEREVSNEVRTWGKITYLFTKTPVSTEVKRDNGALPYISKFFYKHNNDILHTQ